MDRRTFLRLASLVPLSSNFEITDARRDFAALRDRYFIRSLRDNPVVATYLGAASARPELAGVDGLLRDLSDDAVSDMVAFHRRTLEELAAIPEFLLDGQERVDKKVIEAQSSFRIHQYSERRAHQRAVDAWVIEPFRGVSLHLQQMDHAVAGEWDLLCSRLEAVPRFLHTARASLRAGIRDGNLPDHQMVRRDGVGGCEANAQWFGATLPALVRLRCPSSRAKRLSSACGTAKVEWQRFGVFLDGAYDATDRDRYAVGSREYAWRLSHCLAVDLSPEQIQARGLAAIAQAKEAMVAAASQVAAEAGMRLSFAAGSRTDSIGKVFAYLQKDAARSDHELFADFRATALRALSFAQTCGLFGDPQIVMPEVEAMPSIMGGTTEAAYFPAPPLRPGGKPRFYAPLTGGDPESLACFCRASIANLVVHELVPGHHLHYSLLNAAGTRKHDVRWLTPGDVENSLSMWEDSMAAEGWATLAEELGAAGFFNNAERLYQAQNRLVCALVQYLDPALHLGHLTFTEAVDFSIETMMGSDNAGRPGHALQAYRLSKWPTQAITYALGRDEIVGLREEARAAGMGERAFYQAFLTAGTVPPGLLRPLLIAPASRPI